MSAADWENWGENDRMLEGVGGGEGNIKLSFHFFFLFFLSPPTLGKAKALPWMPEVFLSLGNGILRILLFPHSEREKRLAARVPEHAMEIYISTRPAKIRLHCRLG